MPLPTGIPRSESLTFSDLVETTTPHVKTDFQWPGTATKSEKMSPQELDGRMEARMAQWVPIESQVRCHLDQALHYDHLHLAVRQGLSP